jgi:hypothetical protein
MKRNISGYLFQTKRKAIRVYNKLERGVINHNVSEDACGLLLANTIQPEFDEVVKLYFYKRFER